MDERMKTSVIVSVGTEFFNVIYYDAMSLTGP